MDEWPLWEMIDRAVSHLCMARFGLCCPVARASLYRIAAGMFQAVAEQLLEMSDDEQCMTKTREMVLRWYGP